MRIGMILDKTFPPDPRVENEAISLLKNGHEVILFCLHYNNAQNYSEKVYGIQVKRYKSTKLLYKLSALAYTVPFYSMIMKSKIKHFLIENRIESIHIHDMQIAEAVFWANKKLQLPVVLDLHDNLPEVMKFYPHLQKFPGKFLISPKKWKQKEEEFIHKADYICTVSPEFVKEIRNRTKISKSKIKLVPNSVLPSFYKNISLDESILNKFKKRFVLLYVGDTAIRRGLLTAIKSLTYLKETIPNVLLVIVGKSSTDAILFNEVKKYKLEEYVSFEGWQNVNLFPSYIEASHICISPLYRNKQHDVAYANKIFQYMSLSKPLLVSNAKAQKVLVETNKVGLIHKEKDPKDFSEKVLKLYKNEDLRNTFGKNAKKFIEEEYNWDITSKSLLNLYAELSK